MTTTKTDFLMHYFSGFLIVVFLLYQSVSTAQNGIKLNTPDAYKGLTLCTAENIGNTYLVDNCGRIVNEWTNTFPRHYCRLTEEGNLLYIQGNRIIEKSWNGSTVKSIEPNTTDLFLDYEVMKLENGNYLAVARRIITPADFQEIGWSPGIPIPDRIDGIVEIAPNGDIVWEWNIKDHTIQDQISSASNFGNIGEHPELVDVNSISDYDWEFGESFMINGMDYNAELDQIVISVRKVSEIMIIDHSTTTAEAAGSHGGRYGKGGDILYRWGNPQNYGQGDESDRVLYFQHNPNWVRYGEHKGKIIMFNNGLTREVPGFGDFSSVHIIDTHANSDGSYTLNSSGSFHPIEADLTIDEATTGLHFDSQYTSGAQVLPNGSVYITVGLPADFIEVAPDNDVVWDYTLAFSYYIFRSEKYPLDFPGFDGKDLSAIGTVESPSSTYECEIFTSLIDADEMNRFSIEYNPFNVTLSFEGISPIENVIIVKDMQGRLIKSINNVRNYDQLVLDNISKGMYAVTLFDVNSSGKISRKFIHF